MMSKKKSSKQRLPRDENEASSTTTSSMIVDEVNDYEYFKVLWNEKMVGTNKQRGDNNDEKQSSCVQQEQDAAMHQPKKKRRKKLPKGRKKMQKLSDDDDNNKSTSHLHHYEDDTIIATNVEGRKRGSRTSTKRKRASGNKSTTQHQKMMSTDIESKHDVPLYERISRHQLNTLLGWASSHRRGNENNNSDTKASSEKEREIDLSHLPTAPPPPSHIAFLQQHMSKRLQTNNELLGDVAGKKKKGSNCNTATITTKQNNHNMHVSAYVAVGMAVEEALTARLMPLAKAHFQRCRILERKAHDLAECLREESITKIQSLQKKFLQKKLAGAILDVWTLPPEDVVMQLARDGTVKGNDALSSLLLGRKSELEDSE